MAFEIFQSLDFTTSRACQMTNKHHGWQEYFQEHFQEIEIPFC